jgi:fibronectin type 3 domain-containing protein
MKRFYLSMLSVLIISSMAAYTYAYDMTLAWDPNSEMDIVSYNLYVRDDSSSSYSLFDELTIGEIDPDNPQFMVTDMESDVTYDFVVTAVNNVGSESSFSNEVSVLNGQAFLPVVSSGSSEAGGGGCFISTSSYGTLIR